MSVGEQLTRSSRILELTSTGTMHDLDSVVRVLEQYRQRATYGAVAGVIGSNAQSVMGNRLRTPFYSWVVNAKSKLPTGYAPSECHPMLRQRSRVIDDATELYQWLRDPY